MTGKRLLFKLRWFFECTYMVKKIEFFEFPDRNQWITVRVFVRFLVHSILEVLFNPELEIVPYQKIDLQDNHDAIINHPKTPLDDPPQ